MEIFCCANIDADATLTTTIDQLLRRPTAGDIDVLIVVVDVFCARLVKVYIEERDDTTAVSNFIATSVGTYFDSYKYQGIEYVLAREDLWTVDDSSKVTLLTRELCPALFPVLAMHKVVVMFDSSALQPRSCILATLFLTMFSDDTISIIETTSLAIESVPVRHIKTGQYPLQVREWWKEQDLKSAVPTAVDMVLSKLDWQAGFTQASKLLLHRSAFGMARLTVNPRILDSLDYKITSHLQSNTVQRPAASDFMKSCLSARSVTDGIKVFEFFSGIGGMRLALPDMIHGQAVREICAVDVSLIANGVYSHNFHAPIRRYPRHIEKNSYLYQGDIKAFGVKELDGQSHVWTLSPPCQPFTRTRGARQLDNHDTRSQGLYHLLHMLLSINKLPEFIVMENVAAFRGSYMHSLWRAVLQHVGYKAKEMVLSPHLCVGLPNSRTRYFCVARFAGRASLGLNGASFEAMECEMRASTQLAAAVSNCCVQTHKGGSDEESNGEEDNREMEHGHQDGSTTPCSRSLRHTGPAASLHQILGDRMDFINEKVLAQEGEYARLIVSKEILSSSWAPQNLSLVDGDDTLTYCFTKGYGKRVDHSAGSCLLMRSITSKDVDRSRLVDYHGQIRLFHPDELLLLFGYPADYSFPEGMSLQHRWGCIGNSVNVKVVSKVMQYLFNSE